VSEIEEEQEEGGRGEEGAGAERDKVEARW
jgi:hypothetical protein